MMCAQAYDLCELRRSLTGINWLKNSQHWGFLQKDAICFKWDFNFHLLNFLKFNSSEWMRIDDREACSFYNIAVRIGIFYSHRMVRHNRGMVAVYSKIIWWVLLYLGFLSRRYQIMGIISLPKKLNCWCQGFAFSGDVLKRIFWW